MFEICIDENGYYTEGQTRRLVDVKEIPEVSDIRLLQAYQYDNGTLQKDEIRYAAIKKEITAETAPSTMQERLEAMEEAVMELAEMLGGEQDG